MAETFNKQPKTGLNKKIPNDTFHINYGTVNKHNCKCFYLSLRTWLFIGEVEDKQRYLDSFIQQMQRYIRGNANSLSNDYLYSFCSVDLSSDIDKLKINRSYLDIELTCFVNKPIKALKSDKELKTNIDNLIKLIEQNIDTYSFIQISKDKKIKAIV